MPTPANHKQQGGNEVGNINREQMCRVNRIHASSPDASLSLTTRFRGGKLGSGTLVKSSSASSILTDVSTISLAARRGRAEEV